MKHSEEELNGEQLVQVEKQGCEVENATSGVRPGLLVLKVAQSVTGLRARACAS